MSKKSGPLRGPRVLAIPVLMAGVLLMAGAEWRRMRISSEYDAIDPPDMRGLHQDRDAEKREHVSEEQLVRERDLLAALARQRAAEATRRLYSAVWLELAGAVLCLLGALPWVGTQAPEPATEPDALTPGESQSRTSPWAGETVPLPAESAGWQMTNSPQQPQGHGWTTAERRQSDRSSR